jgi:prepilin-type N-terminal cleavage/methylation domain-containing protein
VDNERGFSIVELMIVVAILAMLGVMASARLQTFIVRARQVEVKTNMNHIRTLIDSYWNANPNGPPFGAGGWYGAPMGIFTNCSPTVWTVLVGFSIKGCDLSSVNPHVRYMYNLTGLSRQYYEMIGFDTDSVDLVCGNTTSNDAWSYNTDPSRAVLLGLNSYKHMLKCTF